MKGSRGFSLIELVAIIVVLSLGLVGLTALFGQTVGSVDINDRLGVAAQAAQRCAEHVLARRRVDPAIGFAGVASGLCAGLPAYNGFTATDVVAAYAGTGCPGGAGCKQVTVTASDGSTSRSLQLMVVDY